MTFDEYLRHGHVSRLSEIKGGGGPSASTVNTQSQLTQQQLNLAQTEQSTSAADRERAQELQQPLIDKEKSLAGGDRTEALRASLPVISKISHGYQAAKDSVFNTIPAGAARDKAMADIEVQKSVAPAMAQASAVAGAPEVLANIGSGYGAFSLQELGAALGGYSGASNSNATAGSMQAQQSAAKWAPLTALAGTAGSAAGNIFFGKG